MSLLSLIEIFQAVLTKTGIKADGNEHSTNLANNQICTGDICVCTWKPHSTPKIKDAPRTNVNA